ncbi:symmetrical bis(5'-nucleosyl)-tetraphosphatase [Buchnera aphidicola]|uniref:bis(5'-nucleosyl)-tetraphosphatase (symmetrical) n=1 Tax=Buchnera aphidicola (Sarucallis kahawaluokalani) TaxID=1241878 RepID=A0A4D6YHT1_9GAMM|nr:symmetrical bis(5'-nucleosyl)-tetraphosphatase [Buchnera aphidicola]QCI25901.1 symmetrical bis(5'-nucleosyl)-tetraphosphatase [Buchnera aphidicola (Sarucallis kahawaluokalani)]
MSTYLISDIHGHFKQLDLLLKKVSFNPIYDTLLVAGDLIGRGPNSLEVLLYLQSLKEKVIVVLGNHDINTVLTYYGLKEYDETLQLGALFRSNKLHTLIEWLRKQSFLYIDKIKNIILVHAGLYPYWDIYTLQYYARKIQYFLSSDDFLNFLKEIRNTDRFIHWNNELTLLDKIKFSINVFTKMRYLYFNKSLNLHYKYAPSKISKCKGLIPWFDIKNLIDKRYSIFFGHWAALSDKMNIYNNIILLDTGCSWGKYLSLFRWDDKKWFIQK